MVTRRYLKGEDAEAVVEDFTFLLDVGEYVDRALRRVGMTAAGMEKLLVRRGVELPAQLVGVAAQRRREGLRNG
ncbi:hypothetical protein [Rhodococcus sp. 14-2470-1a]|uniref:hypothetical protein n=1 Tax=Rhodococcus sp. 14-2470-1a TaxID=2023150 RepID=UPI000B9BEF7F|nr:hypothetical protein [Rhodococcus sp. 14-2470-1a]OZF41904.1 hypothetical protein CH292_27240 [Rhodococcus sp. 14-2470-1a]